MYSTEACELISLRFFLHEGGFSLDLPCDALGRLYCFPHFSLARALPWLVHNHMTHQSFVSVQKDLPAGGFEWERIATEHRSKRREIKKDRETSEKRKERKGRRISLPLCFLQFLYIPATLWGITQSISPNTEANTPTHLTHAYTALISHSIAQWLTETLRVDWLTVRSDTSHVSAVTAWATSHGIPNNRIM